ncbi:MAG: hypothetical protein R3E98_21375 [Gemmatimonadota bacterium]
MACVLLSAALASISTSTSVRAQAPERTSMRGDSGMVIRTELDGPESALHDEAADVYLVSNVAGGPSAADGNGFISRIGPDGTVLDARWIDSGQDGVTLNAPKGLALSADTLFVADLDVVRRFHRETGESLGEWPVPGATFLNAVAVGPDGAVYVTDTGIEFVDGRAEPRGTDAVYRFGLDGEPLTVAEGDDLGGPNGIVVDEQGAVVVTFGGDRVYRVDRAGNTSPVATLPQGQLDGLVQLPGEDHLVTSWSARGVYRIGPDGSASQVVEGLSSPADIGYDAERGRLLIPLLQQNELHVVPIETDMRVSDDPMDGYAPAVTTAGDRADDAATLGVARHDELGAYLTDGEGRALYLFKSDTAGQSTCFDRCADVWPPLLTDGMAEATDDALQSSLIGTLRRPDGTMQVTYGGWPLYYYEQDRGPGDIQGQDIMGFGAEWYLIGPDGAEVEHEEGNGR